MITPIKPSKNLMEYAKKHGIVLHRLGPRQRKWVNDLRSGKFTKARSILKGFTSTGNVYHCCLGVACEAVPNLKSEVRDEDPGSGPLFGSVFPKKFEVFGSAAADLPNKAVNYYDFFSSHGDIDTDWLDSAYEAIDNNKPCAALRELKAYVKRFDIQQGRTGDLTVMNDSRKPKYPHSFIASFVEAYPQAIFSKRK